MGRDTHPSRLRSFRTPQNVSGVACREWNWLGVASGIGGMFSLFWQTLWNCNPHSPKQHSKHSLPSGIQSPNLLPVLFWLVEFLSVFYAGWVCVYGAGCCPRLHIPGWLLQFIHQCWNIRIWDLLLKLVWTEGISDGIMCLCNFFLVWWLEWPTHPNLDFGWWVWNRDVCFCLFLLESICKEPRLWKQMDVYSCVVSCLRFLWYDVEN